jgi:hypothetical protein
MAEVGSELVIRATISDVNGVLSSPSVVDAWVKDPSNTVTAVTMAETSDGIFEGSFIPTSDGDWWARILTSGGVTVASEKKFNVAKQQVVP